MAQPYVGEIRMFAGNFAPAGWEFCHGQLLSIDENDTLFTLIGTTYGGDGQSTFALPDLRGRIPIHQGYGTSGGTYVIGQPGGAEEITLTVNQVPSHTHSLLASAQPADTAIPKDQLLAESALDLYVEDSASVNLAAQAIAPVGGSQPHSNLQPFLCVSFIISLFGIFPSPT